MNFTRSLNKLVLLVFQLCFNISAFGTETESLKWSQVLQSIPNKRDKKPNTLEHNHKPNRIRNKMRNNMVVRLKTILCG